jgi:hypothetical protein
MKPYLEKGIYKELKDENIFKSVKVSFLHLSEISTKRNSSYPLKNMLSRIDITAILIPSYTLYFKCLGRL